MLKKTVSVYLIKNISILFLIGMGIFLFFLIMTQLLRLNEFIVIHGVPVRYVFSIFWYLVCMFLGSAIPIALVFAVMGVFGRLSADGEITALRVSGYGLGRMILPVLLFSIVIGLFTHGITSYVEPLGHKQFRYLLRKVITLAFTHEIKEGEFKENFYGMTFYTEGIDYKTKKLQNIIIYNERKDEGAPVVIFAKRGEIVRGEDVGRSEFDIILNLSQGRIVHETKDDRHHQSVRFEKSSLFIRLDEFFKLPSTIPEILNISELIACMRRNPKGKVACEIEFHRRLALSGGCVIFALFAMILGISVHQSARSRSFLLSLLFTVGYWLLLLMSRYAANQGWLPVSLSMWLANIVILIVTVIGFFRLRRTF